MLGAGVPVPRALDRFISIAPRIIPAALPLGSGVLAGRGCCCDLLAASIGAIGPREAVCGAAELRCGAGAGGRDEPPPKLERRLRVGIEEPLALYSDTALRRSAVLAAEAFLASASAAAFLASVAAAARLPAGLLT